MVVLQIVLFLFTIHGIHGSDTDDSLQVITKLPRNPLMKYYSYSSVMILHFNIPFDTTKASFKFKARDDSTSMLVRTCDPRNVSVYMKPGSYPVINPDGVPLPKTFLNFSRPDLHELVLLTDLKSSYINISSPVPGDWFAAAFVSWTDPKKDRIEQQGLTSQCEATLYAELAVIQKTNVKILASNTVTDITLQQKPELFKFYVPEDIDHVLISLEIVRPCKFCENLVALVQTKSIPDENKYEEKLIVSGRTETKEHIRFWSEEKTWHYLNISYIAQGLLKYRQKDYIEMSLSLKYLSGLRLPKDANLTNHLFKSSLNKQLTVKSKSLQNNLPYKQYNMMRLTAPDNFVFEYDFRPNENGSTPILLNVTSDEMAVLKFTVYDIIDIGGTLTIGLAIKPEVKGNKEKSVNYTVVACIHRDAKEIPTYPNLCVFNNLSRKSPLILNSTSAGTLEFMHIPYPDPGTYFLSLRAFYDECVPCNCSTTCEELFEECTMDCEQNCTTDCDTCTEKCESVVMSTDGCQTCNCNGVCEKLAVNETRNTSLVFSISSHPCIAERCGSHGKCNHYMAGGFIFSSCQCFGGYRGWDCSDGSQALSDYDILIAILLLTLSNLLFIPSIYFAFKRSYYTEAVAYFCSMFASTFYHACDSKENQYGFCLFPLGVLQFCDFYCALLAIWVTLVAMAYTNNRIISIAHLTGAVILAFGVTYNKHALWVYLLPTFSGIILIGFNWGMQCRKTRKLFPARRYLKLYMPVGAFLVLMGLISFAFLETKENYKIVHSLWHVVMALSLIFLLPNQKTFAPKG